MSEHDRLDALREEMLDTDVSENPVFGWHVVMAIQGFSGERKGYTIRSAQLPQEFVWKPRTEEGTENRAVCLAPRFHQTADGRQYLLNPLHYGIRKVTGGLREECMSTPGLKCSCGYHALKDYRDALHYARPRLAPPWGTTLQGIVGGLIVMQVNLMGNVNGYGDHHRGEFITPIHGVMFFGSRKSCDAISERYGIPIRRARLKEYIGLYL